MKQLNKRTKIFLIQLMIGTIILNIGYTSILFQISKTDIRFINENVSEIFNKKIKNTKEVYVPTDKGVRKFVIESDVEIKFFRLAIAILALINIIFISLIIFRFYNSNNE